MELKETTIVFEVDDIPFNESCFGVIPRIGESVLIENFNEVVVVDITHDLKKNIAYLKVKKKVLVFSKKP